MTIHTFCRLAAACFLFAASNLWADDCAPTKELTWVKATYATSGDSLVIQDRRVRLIGIKAPQIPRTYKFNTPGQPLAKEAQTLLNKLLANNQLDVGVEYDQETVDNRGRQMVHLFLRDGTNINAEIIKSGFALAQPESVNTLHQQCYFAAEKVARDNRYQLWDLAEKNPELHFPVANSSELRKDDDGWRIIRGKVQTVEASSTYYIVNLDTTGIRIPKERWNAFDFNALQKLAGRVIEVRGLAYFYKGNMFMVIDTPNAIDQLNPLHTQTAP
ncbi:MAG: thermonuclease family protein [Gammaproteobacteria bacterium]|nr:thermonuclease family protein [Gammaproteobacteria bacterium]